MDDYVGNFTWPSHCDEDWFGNWWFHNHPQTINGAYGVCHTGNFRYFKNQFGRLQEKCFHCWPVVSSRDGLGIKVAH